MFLGVLAALHPLNRLAIAQPPQAAQLTPEQLAARNEAMARARAASESDRQRMMDLLGLKAPDALPPPSTDPNRPAYLTQRTAGPASNWYDSVGNTFVRSQWGNWSNYDEARAGATTASPDPLVLKNGSARHRRRHLVEQAAPRDPRRLPHRDLRPDAELHAEGDVRGHFGRLGDLCRPGDREEGDRSHRQRAVSRRQAEHRHHDVPPGARGGPRAGGRHGRRVLRATAGSCPEASHRSSPWAGPPPA